MEILIGLFFLIGAVSLLLHGLPIFVYNTFRMALEKKENVPPSWHDFWGMNTVNLIFFPSMLNDEGRMYRRKAIALFPRIIVGLIASFLAAYFLRAA
jgi:hypothetical protein